MILLGLYGCIIPPHRDSCSTCSGEVRREERERKRGRKGGRKKRRKGGREGGMDWEREERREKGEGRGREEKTVETKRRGMVTKESRVVILQSTDPVVNYLLV